jgi:hypothetical protein
MNRISKTRTLVMKYASKIRKPSEHWKLSTVTLIAALPLSGCMGIYEGGFECPAGVGVGCKSISGVNDMVNQGDLPRHSPNQLIQAKPEIWYSPHFRNQSECAQKDWNKVPRLRREKEAGWSNV